MVARVLVLASISESLVNMAWHFVRDAGLPAVFVLMLAESACVPIPSEATMLFAGFAVADPGASTAHHHLTLAGCVPWVLGLGLAGEAVGDEWKSVRKGFDYVDYAVVALVVIALVYLLIRRRRGGADTGDPAPDVAA